jgi:hypothetical protein
MQNSRSAVLGTSREVKLVVATARVANTKGSIVNVSIMNRAEDKEYAFNAD